MAIAIERSGVTTRRIKRYRARRWIGHALVYLGLAASLVFFLGPFFWIVTTSLKGNEDFFAYPPVWIPSPPSLRHYVREIGEVEICRNLEAPGSLPTRTLLLIGWLASSLGWERLSAHRSGDEWVSRWKSGSGQVIARFTGSITGEGKPSGISAVTLRTRSGAVFSVSRKEGEPRIIATVAGIDSALSHSVIEEPMDEASLLIRELSVIGRDHVFESAFDLATALEGSFEG